MGGAAVRPDVCPQPTAGATVRLVCAFSSPLLGAGFTGGGMARLAYLHTEACGAGDLAYELGWIGMVHGRGSLSSLFPSEIHFRRGPEAPGGSQTRWRDGSAEAQVGCLLGASKFPGRNWFPLGFWLGDGRGRWRWRAPLSRIKLSPVIWGSTTLPPIVFQPSRSPS